MIGGKVFAPQVFRFLFLRYGSKALFQIGNNIVEVIR